MKASKDNPTTVEDPGPVLAIGCEVGDYTVHFITLRVDLDMTPLLKGLPNDQCTAEHFGYVTKGRMTFRYDDHDEVIEAGEAFRATPGHVPISNEPGTEYVQFTPSDQLVALDEAIQRNLAAMQPAG